MTTQITMTKTWNGTRIEVQGSDVGDVTKALEAAVDAVKKSKIPPTEVAGSGNVKR